MTDQEKTDLQVAYDTLEYYNRWRIRLFLFALALAFCGCKGTQQVVERPVYIHDTSEEVSVQKDSVFVHDSVYVYKGGDTLYISRWRTRYVEVQKHDTIREVQEIPVEVEKLEVKEVEKPLTWWQKFRMSVGGIVLWLALLALGAWIVKDRLVKR